LGVDVRIILKWIYEGIGWMELIQDKDQWPGSYEHCIELLGFIKW
jgi:hypothetical protein